MTEQEIANLIAKYLVGNLGAVLTSLVALIVTTSTLTWFIFHTIHKKEVAILKQRIEANEDNFNQFSRIMEQRLVMAETYAELIEKKLTMKSEAETGKLQVSDAVEVFYQKSISSDIKDEVNENNEKSTDEKPRFSLTSNKHELGDFIERISTLSSMLKVLNKLV